MRSGSLIVLLWVAASIGAPAQSTYDVSVVLDRVGERLAQYYKRAQNIMCIETMTAQPIGSDLTPRGFARIVESELRVEPELADDDTAPNGVKVLRSVRRINGRAPKPKDKEACYDPNPLSDEPLAFLLPSSRKEYAFSWGGFGKGKEQNLMIIEYRSLESGKPSVKEHDRGREDCLSFSLPGGTKGRVFIDTATHDVMRVEERLISMIDFRIPFDIQRKHNFPDATTLDRFDRYVRYKPIAFTDPDETMLLPESIDELVVWRSGGSHRTRQQYSSYKRFLTAGRIVK